MPEREGDLDALGQMLIARGYKLEASSISLSIRCDVSELRETAADVNRMAAAAGMVLIELRPEKTNLEDRYLAIVNGGEQ